MNKELMIEKLEELLFKLLFEYKDKNYIDRDTLGKIIDLLSTNLVNPSK